MEQTTNCIQPITKYETGKKKKKKPSERDEAMKLFGLHKEEK